jgi:hypothetical protein
MCRYRLDLNTDGDETTGTLFPVVDSRGANRRGSDAYTGDSSEDDGPSATEAFSSSYAGPLSPRRVISEGPNSGKIKVGPDHQAVIPDQVRVLNCVQYI